MVAVPISSTQCQGCYHLGLSTGAKPDLDPHTLWINLLVDARSQSAHTVRTP